MGCGVGRQFVVALPVSCELRRTIQNVLRVAWLDVLENAGWRVASASNCEYGVHPLPVAAGQPVSSVDSRTSFGGFQGECTSFVLIKQSPAPGIFVHGDRCKRPPLLFALPNTMHAETFP